jgi:hypothetical protein
MSKEDKKMLQGHCMKCKEKREMKDVRIETTSRGGYMARGKCMHCGTNMAKILSKEDAMKHKK